MDESALRFHRTSLTVSVPAADHAAKEEPGRCRELVRGKMARVGSSVALTTLMKGQPLTYNKDNQGRQGTADTVDTITQTLIIIMPTWSAASGSRPIVREAAAREGLPPRPICRLPGGKWRCCSAGIRMRHRARSQGRRSEGRRSLRTCR